jgi:hypothetical protein
VQATLLYGGTSGRFFVAALVKRVFPAFRWYAAELENGLHLMEEPFDPLPSGPSPHDTLVFRSDRTVEYTPAPAQCLGTLSRLSNPDINAWRLALRLPHPRRPIVEVAESDAATW